MIKIGDLLPTPRPAGGRGDGGGPAAVKPVAPQANLEQGALLRGRVVSAGADGRLVLDLAGQRIEARSTVPLPPGREFWFEVRQGGQDPRLALADKQGGVQRFLQQASGGLQDLNRLGTLLSLLGRSLPATGLATPSLPGGPAAGEGDPTALLARLFLGSEPEPEKIVRLLTMLRGGEAVLAGRGPLPNLAGRLQALVAGAGAPPQPALAEDGASPPAASLREALAGLARAGGVLEALVTMNEQPPPPGQPPFWLLPCFFALDAGAGSWLLSRGEAGEEGEESSSLVFFLEMSRLGELQLQVRVRRERLEGDFFLADPETARFLRGRLGELRERLAALGYQSVLRCRVGGEPLLPALKAALEKATGSASRQLIDIKA
ncbi:flagellar hook-length control protein FliK [Desulfurivibrio sp. D14AmB]|uniref:flagellar hook-length control protein FliK n=1 Tax=Desulfurivibrio sp. D14AmB TaxID=3374370 RepID=UPI00376ED878